MTERSFTSSSEALRGSMRAVLLALALSGCVVGLGEVAARSHGFRAARRDDAGLWSTWRQRADAAGAHALALVGSSRFQTGLDPAAFERAFPDRAAISLAINGSSPLPVLQDLAQDERFHGAVLCEVLPHAFFADAPQPELHAADWVHANRTKTFIADAENSLRDEFRTRLAVLLPDLSHEQLAQALLRRRAPTPGYSALDDRRSVRADFTKTDAASIAARNAKDFATVGRPLSEAERRARYAAIRAWVAKIVQRGGTVVFVRMVATGDVLRAEERRFPYFDEFAREVGAPAVSFDREPELAGFDCPDGSHLDQRDRARFSEALGAVLRRKGWL